MEVGILARIVRLMIPVLTLHLPRFGWPRRPEFITTGGCTVATLLVAVPPVAAVLVARLTADGLAGAVGLVVLFPAEEDRKVVRAPATIRRLLTAVLIVPVPPLKLNPATINHAISLFQFQNQVAEQEQLRALLEE